MKNNFLLKIQKKDIVSFLENNKLFPAGTTKEDIRHFKNKNGKINFFILPPNENFSLENNILCEFSSFSYRIQNEKSNDKLWQGYLSKKFGSEYTSALDRYNQDNNFSL